MNNIHPEVIAVPIVQEAHDWAIKFAAEQSTPQKSKRVYLNTLAVYAVHTYLQWLQIDTDLDEGDSWHPGVRPLLNVADLVVPGVGKLECRPVLPGKTSFTLPTEVLEERISYVAVQFKESLDEVDLLGFAPAFDPTDLPNEVEIDQLLPIEDLSEHIDFIAEGIEFLEGDNPIAVAVRKFLETQSLTSFVTQLERIYRDESETKQPYAVMELLENTNASGEGELALKSRERDTFALELTGQAEDTLQLAKNLLKKVKQIWGERLESAIADSTLGVPANAIASLPQMLVPFSPGEMLENLRQWFANLFEGDWLAPSMVLAPAYRGANSEEPEGSIKRTKIIDLRADQAVVLVVQLTPESAQEVGVIVQVYPGNNARHLPVGLQVIALDESGATILDEQAESGADSIQLEFSIEPRERFSVRIILADVTVAENI